MSVHRSLDHRGFTLLEVLFVVGLIGVISAIAVPMMGNTLGFFRLSGDARSIHNLAAVAKMRSAAEFTRVRVYADLSAGTFRLQSWDKTLSPANWVTVGGITNLSPTVSYGFGSVGTPPPNTQASIAQASVCQDKDGVAITNTACVMFNSRGVPIDGAGAPTASGALYVTDGVAVYGFTVAASGMMRLWRTGNTSTPTWVRN